MADNDGKLLRLDPNVKSSSPELPAFIAKPDGAPVYHGFPVVEESRIDGWVFGTITDYEDPNGCEYGDAFVVAPDGTRAGIVWQIDHFDPAEICPANKDRWGVYGFAYHSAIRTTADFVKMCHSFLPELKKRYSAAKSKMDND